MTRSAKFWIAAVTCALLAAWLSFSYTGRAPSAGGRMRAVVVSTQGLPRGATEDAIVARVQTRRLPAAFAPADAIAGVDELTGRRLIAPLPAGAFLTTSLLSQDATSGGYRLRTHERAVSVDVIVSPAGSELAGGERVDLYASGFDGGQRTLQLISGAEVLSADPLPRSNRAQVTLRLAAAQVAAVVRADVFARELRAVTLPGR